MKGKFLAWSERVANSKNALKTLFWVSFAESCISPFPAYFLVIFILAQKTKYTWQKVASVSTISSVLGGIGGYFIGLFLFHIIGEPILNFYHLQADFASFGAKLHANEFLILLIAAMTPIPFKVASIASGVFSVNFILFILTAILGRGLKFTIISYLTSKYGERMKDNLLKNPLVSVITFILILGLIYFIFFS